MTSDFLHRLTGRLDDFLEPLMNHGAKSLAPATNPELREWLGLNNRSTDVFVRALLVAAEAHPEDCPMDLYFSCVDLPLERWRVTGAALVATSQFASDMRYRPAIFPFPVDIRLAYLDAKRALLFAGDRDEIVSVSEAGTVLSVEWSAWTGIVGALQMHQPWAAEFHVTITAPPVSFPYESLRREVLARADATALLQAHGLLDAVFSAINPVRAAALLTRALTS